MAAVPDVPAGPAPALPDRAEILTDDQILSQVTHYPSDDLSRELGDLFDAAVTESTTPASPPADGPVEVGPQHVNSSS